jgi:hypothetical protein
MKQFDNNTIAVTGLVIGLLVAVLFQGSEEIQIGIASGLIGFITGVNTPKAL